MIWFVLGPETQTAVQEESQPRPHCGHQAQSEAAEDPGGTSQAEPGQGGVLEETRGGVPADGGGGEALLGGEEAVRGGERRQQLVQEVPWQGPASGQVRSWWPWGALWAFYDEEAGYGG